MPGTDDQYELTPLETELRDYLMAHFRELYDQVDQRSRCIAVPRRFADAVRMGDGINATFLMLPLIADDIDHAEVRESCLTS